MPRKSRTTSRGGGGYIELPSSEHGEFVDAVAFREQLVFFRERGIVLLKAGGDAFNFKAVPLKFGGGTVLRGSVADCGDAILFCSQGGLYAYTGSQCTRLENSYLSQLTQLPVNASCYAGNYYAACTHRTFGKCLYCYDRSTGRAHFILQSGEYTASGENAYTLGGSTVYLLNAKGMPQNGACTLTCSGTALGLLGEERLLDGVSIEGSGRFTLTVRTESGLSYSVGGSAGEFLRLPATVRGGKFTVTVKADGTEFEIRKLTFHAREASHDD